MRGRSVVFLCVSLGLLSVAGCGDDDGPKECTTAGDCPAGQICTPAGVCAPDPGMTSCSSDTDCDPDGGAGGLLLCNMTTGRCMTAMLDACPDQALVDRVCAVSRNDTFCVDNLFVNCAGDTAECTECEMGCTIDGCAMPRPDMGPPPRDMGPPPEDMGPPPRDMGPPPAVCGNDVIEDGEQCDPPAPPTCGELRGCGPTCRFVDRTPTCGDGCADPGEECGDAMSGGCATGEVCRSCGCFVPACDDGFADPGEECGEPTLPACAAGEVCTSGCMCGPPVCGNGDAEPGETCGEPGLADCPMGQACMGCVCQPGPACGDGTADMGEECGEPMLPDCAAGSACMNCRCAVLCGNGTADPGEECGEPMLDCAAGSACADCHCMPTSACGNGRLDPGETCDPPTMASCASSTFCSARCQQLPRPAVCGNGCADPGETCGEPGLPGSCSTGTCTGCRCPAPRCGDGVRNGTEQCDGSDLSGCILVAGGPVPPFVCRPPGDALGGCTCNAVQCFDGEIDAPYEECDFTFDGKSYVPFGCTGRDECNEGCGCDPHRCADGVLNSPGYDTCDDVAMPCLGGSGPCNPFGFGGACVCVGITF